MNARRISELSTAPLEMNSAMLASIMDISPVFMIWSLSFTRWGWVLDAQNNTYCLYLLSSEQMRSYSVLLFSNTFVYLLTFTGRFFLCLFGADCSTVLASSYSHYYKKKLIRGEQNWLTDAVFAIASDQRSPKMTYFLRQLCARFS